MASDLIFQIHDRFEKFKLQTIKDFELAGAFENIPCLESSNLSELETSFHLSILKIENENTLKNLLYQIDLTKHQIKQASGKQSHLSPQQIIAQLMIKRILQKVILKELYSNGNNHELEHP